MRWLLTLALLVAAAWPAVAEENDAEKLFRVMEKKVNEAKTLKIRFDANITGADAKKWNLKGTLVLGEGDRFRVESEGKLFGEETKFTVVSDGTGAKSFGYTKAPGQPNKDRSETEKPPKGAGAYFRAALPRNGFFVSFLNMDKRGDRSADLFEPSDFKLAGEAKVGEQDTKVIQYTVKVKGKDGNAPSVKLWLDAKTNLPVKLALTGGGSDITDITETYSEFSIDAKVDAKLFELPK
jgi:outer membrane lipoprotein-sorting protein